VAVLYREPTIHPAVVSVPAVQVGQKFPTQGSQVLVDCTDENCVPGTKPRRHSAVVLAGDAAVPDLYPDGTPIVRD
jgi:hypothetical protein